MTTNLVLFNGVDASGKAGLWVTDGTSAGTWELSVAGSAFSNSVPTGPQYITAFGSEVLFEGEDPSHFEDLWVTDGTSPGTSELAVPGVDWQFGLQPRWLTVFGSEVLFDGTETNHRSGLWVTDGTVAGTSEISVAGANPNGLAPSHFTVFGNKVLFLGGGTGSGAANSGVWVTNGTSAGTSELSIAGAYSGGLFGLSSPPPNFAALGNKVLFQGWDAQIRSGLWVTDGTSAGTSEIVAGLAGGIDPTDLTTFGSEVLFNGTGPDNGVFNHRLLFVSDGTSAGTSQIPVAGAGSGGVDPTDLTVFGNKVLFGGVDVGGHRNLWITDGTPVGTSEIPVLRAASSGLGPSNFVVFGSEVLFNGIDAADHNGLWVTDGTSAGTSEIAVAGAGTNGLNPSHFAVFSQTLVRPVLSNIPVTDVFAARGPAITLAPSLHVTDPNSTVLVGATVSISGGTFANDGEVLTAVSSGTSITANYDSATETLTLTGTDSISDYQQVLDSVTFGSTSQNPTNFLSNSTRTLTWVVNDGSASNSLSTAETTTISISHSPPSLSGVAANVGFTEGGTAVTLSPTLVVVDQDSLTLVSAALAIGGQLFSGSDLLSASTSGTSITASYNGFTEVLTLTGTDTISHYQQVLDSITYRNSNNNPTTYGSAPTRTISWTINDGSLSNNPLSSTTVSLTAVNNPPTIFNIVGTPALTENQTVSLASFVGVSDPDNLALAGASVAITSGAFAGDGDVLAAKTAGTSITASYNSTTETLTLSGADTLSHYETVLESVTFSAGRNPTDFGSNPTRTFTWMLNDGGASNSLSTPVTTTISIAPAPRNDVNADGISDILLQNTNGTPQIWLMNGAAVTSMTSLINPGPSWHVAATGDFNVDGTADLLWQNNDGLPSIWEMNGTSIIGGGLLPNPGPSWHVIATGDFNNDARADILFQNTDGAAAIWEMNGTSIIGGGVLINPGSSWHMIGAGDFNGDGKADILWQNTDGMPAIWEMNGTSIIGGGVLPNPGTSWHAIGTGDFNGDGKADILWQNTDGAPAIWEMYGGSIIGGGVLPNPSVAWQVKDDGPIPADQMGNAATARFLPAPSGALHLSAPDLFAGGAVPALGDQTAPMGSGHLPLAAPQMFRT